MLLDLVIRWCRKEKPESVFKFLPPIPIRISIGPWRLSLKSAANLESLVDEFVSIFLLCVGQLDMQH